MAVTVEFFTIPRKRAGVSSLETAAGSLGHVLCRIGERLPEFASECLEGDRLKVGYVANINGQKFVGDVDVKLHDGDHLLILSADVGG